MMETVYKKENSERTALKQSATLNGVSIMGER